MNTVTLPADPRTASEARRFIRDLLTDWDEHEALDVAELLLSELVTNAVLHAGSAVVVSVQRRTRALHVEVGDLSATRPTERHHEVMSTTGRGLDLVQALASSWGVEARQPAGKAIWFEVEARHDEPRGQDPTAAIDVTPGTAPPTRVDVELLGTPAQLFIAMEQHLHAALREYVLTMVATDDDPWEAPVLPFDVHALVGQVTAAMAAGNGIVNLVFTVPVDASAAVENVRQALDETEHLAVAGLLLTAPTLPEIRACRDWFLREVTAQLAVRRGHRDPRPDRPRRHGGYLSPHRCLGVRLHGYSRCAGLNRPRTPTVGVRRVPQAPPTPQDDRRYTSA